MKPNNPNPFYMVYQSFWSELRLKDRMDETFDFITFSNQSYRKV